MEGSPLSSCLDHDVAKENPQARRHLLRAAAALLFVAGVAFGGVVHGQNAGTGAAAAPAQVAAWLALPDKGGVVTPVVPAPPPPAPSAPAPPTTAPPPPAQPSPSSSTTAPPDPPTAAERVSQALGRITYPWQRLGYRIVFMGPQPGIWGRTSQPSMSTIEIYVRPDESVDMLAHVIAHEIGHAVDLVYGSDQRRSVWFNLRDISPRPWFTCSMCQDFSTPAGDFAETFAYWQLGDFSRSMLAPAPTPAELSQLTALFSPPS